ncbi:hypothetical protein QBC47DRAFT_417316, partial [Echria macrotheca]
MAAPDANNSPRPGLIIYQALGGVSVLGGTVTLAAMFTDIADPAKARDEWYEEMEKLSPGSSDPETWPNLSRTRVRQFLLISAGLFMMMFILIVNGQINYATQSEDTSEAHREETTANVNGAPSQEKPETKNSDSQDPFTSVGATKPDTGETSQTTCSHDSGVENQHTADNNTRPEMHGEHRSKTKSVQAWIGSVGRLFAIGPTSNTFLRIVYIVETVLTLGLALFLLLFSAAAYISWGCLWATWTFGGFLLLGLLFSVRPLF